MKRKPRKTLSFNLGELRILQASLEYSDENNTYLFDKINKAFQDVLKRKNERTPK